jgi:Na+/glutamate symporter
MINIFNIIFALLVFAPLFLLNELERWQKIGYVVGVVLWLSNLLFVGSLALGIIAFLVLFISCVRLIVDHFPIRL